MPDQSSLFGSDTTPSTKKNTSTGEPLAARMRPRTLDENSWPRTSFGAWARTAPQH